MQFDFDNIPGFKLGLHCFQIIFAFIVFILEIVVFRSDLALIVGNNVWPLVLCFLSIPAWVFLLMTPRFERTRRFAQPHAMLAVDAVFAILWLSAVASQASYNTANACGLGCSVSKGVVALAFFELLFWIGTALFSGLTLKYYIDHNELPGYEKIGANRGHQNIDPDKAAFDMAPHDEEAYAPLGGHDNDHDHREEDHPAGRGAYNDDSYGASSRPMFDSETEYRTNDPAASRPVGGAAGHENPFDTPFEDSYRTDAHMPPHQQDPYHTSYGAQKPAGAGGAAQRTYAAPTAEPAYDDGPAHFPDADYQRTLH